MKALVPGAVFIGFTGTPLLKQDAPTSLEVFGNYIHTYKFGEADDDDVVLDLVYEARDIPQQLGASQRIDAWFDAKTKGLNDWQKAALREQWGTMQKVLSSRSRMERVVEDIVFDFSVKPRLASKRGNAMLVASSIYEAAKYYELFQKTAFKGKCALVTSYNPQAKDVTLEETGANTQTEKQFLFDLGAKFNSPRLNLRLEKARQRAGLRKITRRSLHHTFASQLTMRGVPLNTVQVLLGHASTATTMRYAHVVPSTLRAAIDMLNPKTAVNADFGQPVGNRWLQTQSREAVAKV
jgi:SWI2/SNF2 ATPase/Phage integrase family